VTLLFVVLSRDQFSPFEGHEDWVQCLDSCTDMNSSDLILATGGQDNLIRIWRFQQRTEAETNTINNYDGEIRVREEIVRVGPDLRLAVSLETVLAGHEDKVFGVRWSKGAKG
jgi:WD40 repeat protein